MGLIHYDVTGVSVWDERPGDDRPPEPLPDAAELRRYERDLANSPKLLGWILGRYGLRPETLQEHNIGLGQRPSGPWLTIPIRDEHGGLVNVRRRYVGRNPRLHETGQKYRNLTGRGAPRLYLADRLPSRGSPLLVCCGEFDAMIFRQATGLAAVTSTGGASNWPEGWDDLAERFAVTVTYDRGEEGFATAIGCRLRARIVDLPADLPRGTDLAELYRLRGTTALRQLIKKRAER